MPPIRTTPRPASRRTQRRNRRAEQHRHLVAPIAAHYAAHSPEPREDLEQVGWLGLIRAAELFDPRQAVPFSAYARRHIRGAILHYLRDTAPLVRPSRRLQEQRHQRQRLLQSLASQRGGAASPDDLRRALGMERGPWCSQEERPWEERLWMEQQDRSAATAEEADSSVEAERLLGELHHLKGHERRVVEAVVLEGQSLRTVARAMDSSAATVHRWLHRGLAELRTRLTAPSGARAC